MIPKNVYTSFLSFFTKQPTLNSVRNPKPLVKQTMAELVLDKFYFIYYYNFFFYLKVEKTKNFLGIPLAPLKE